MRLNPPRTQPTFPRESRVKVASTHAKARADDAYWT
jgi:hypothetical protein